MPSKLQTETDRQRDTDRQTDRIDNASQSVRISSDRKNKQTNKIKTSVGTIHITRQAAESQLVSARRGKQH